MASPGASMAMSEEPRPFGQAATSLRPLGTEELPIFRQWGGQYALYYAPGCVCLATAEGSEHLEAAIAARVGARLGLETRPGCPADAPEARWAGELVRCAREAAAEEARRLQEPFRPECLTLYLSDACNLRCEYCYSDPAPAPSARLNVEAIAAAAELVAANCRQRSLPLYAVFHGGGEPTLHRELVESALGRLEATAGRHGIGLYRYVATNGVMSEQAAVWLARRFDLVGLSCDGPPEIQDRQRPTRGGGRTSPLVERTARILREEGRPFHVRSTITSGSLGRQAEVAAYIVERLQPAEIHFEPVYAAGRAGPGDGLVAEQAEAYVCGFLAAQEVARRRRIRLLSSGSRVGALHGPYCNVYRQVLSLVPGGVATACFKAGSAAQAGRMGVAMGAWDEGSGRFAIDLQRISALRQRLAEAPARCGECFNRFHCACDCPDRCPLDPQAPARDDGEPSFRCRVGRALAYEAVHRAGEGLRALAQADGGQRRVYGTTAL